MDDLGALDVSGAELERRLAAVRPDHLRRPSACPGWSVHDLVNRVIGGGHRYVLLLRGAPDEDVAATRTQDHVGPSPVASFREWAAPLRELFADPGALRPVVRHPAGDRQGLEVLRMRVLDQSLHGWDLARSLDLDESLGGELVDYLLEQALPVVEELRELGYYAAPALAPDAATTPIDRLLTLTGRTPL